MQDLIKLAKAKPGEVTFGSSGVARGAAFLLAAVAEDGEVSIRAPTRGAAADGPVPWTELQFRSALLREERLA